MIVAEFSLPSHSFALHDTLATFPNVVVEADRMAAHVPDSTMPCLWTRGSKIDNGFSETLAQDPTLEEVRASAEFDGARLFHVVWSNEIRALVAEMIDHEGVILEASAREDTWRIRIRFMTREQFDEFRAHFNETDIKFTLEQLLEAKHPSHTRGDVTPAQNEALTTAVELGYFQVPREASLREVAEELGVSHQAVSELLRRGTENLIRDMLTIEPIQDI